MPLSPQPDCLLFRKKLESHVDNSPSFRVDSLGELIRDVHPPPPEAETSSIHIEVPPWAESYEISATEVAGVCIITIIISPSVMTVCSSRPAVNRRGYR